MPSTVRQLRVCETAGALGDLPLQQYLTAPPDGYHVGVVAHKAHLSAVRAVKNRHLNVEDIGRVGVAYLHRHDLQEGRDGGALRLRHAGEHLQLGLGVSGHNARRRSCRDAPQPTGMGDYHALTFLMMLPLTSTSTRSGSAPSTLRALAAA